MLGTFPFGRRLLAWDSFECHIMDSVKTGLKNLNVDQATVPGVCTKYIQAPDVSWNKPFKSRCTGEHDNWLRNGRHQYTEAGNMRPPPRREVLKWILLALDSLSYEVIVKSFKPCALTHSLDGSEDHLIHCFKQGHQCEEGEERLRSQLGILDESERGNPFEDTTYYAEIPEMCLIIEADGDDSDVDIDI